MSLGGRALVTGGAGFIGSHVVDALQDRGCEVLVYDDLSSGREANLREAFERGARLIEGDIADAAALVEAFERFEPDVVFHLAAQADVRRSVVDPGFDATVNVIGTINVLEAARIAGQVPIVFASTGGAIYGEGEGRALPFVEESLPAAGSPYAMSKLAAEGYLTLYRSLHRAKGIPLRFSNVYGPRQDPYGEAGVVAIFCGRLLAGEQLTVFGDGLQTRDYVYVGDVVASLLAAADALLGTALSADPADHLTGPYNIGTGIETSVLDLVERLAQASGVEASPILAPARAGEVQRVSIDPAAAAADLGWRPAIGLDDGLRSTFESVSGRSKHARLPPP